MYLASPQNFAGLPQNPFSSLIAMYLIAEEPQSGCARQARGGGVAEPGNGADHDELRRHPAAAVQRPEARIPRRGTRRARDPRACGSYTTEATLTPWSGTKPVTTTSSFQVTSGPGGSPCPSGALPFSPSVLSQAHAVNAGALQPPDRRDQPPRRPAGDPQRHAHLPAGSLSGPHRRSAVPRSPGQRRQLPRGESDRRRHRQRRRGLRSLHRHRRQGLPDRPLRRRPLRPVDRDPDHSGAVRPGRRRPGGHQGEDRDQPEHSGGDRHDGRDPADPRRHPAAGKGDRRQHQPSGLRDQPDQLRTHGVSGSIDAWKGQPHPSQTPSR